MKPSTPLKKPEFVALIAMAFATIAFSIDAMLPALPEIGAELTPDNINRAQLVITSFVLGMGLGTFFTGALSDAFGRKPVLLGGFAIYAIGSLLAILAGSLELMLAARFIQGIGAAGPRVASVAIVRDSFVGRQMAQLMSFVLMVFMLVPAIAPSIGAVIIALAGWRAVFGVFVLFALIVSVWFYMRLPESLAPEHRRKLQATVFWQGMKEVLIHPVVRITILVQTLVLGALYGFLSSSQQIFDISFDQGANFPLWFGAIAVVAGTASIVNAKLVIRLGMRLLIRISLTVEMLISAGFVLLLWSGWMPDAAYFPIFLFFMASMFFMIGMTMGNINAIAMEPMGHIAGMAASVVGAVSTVFGVLIAAPIGLAFDGTPLPLAVGVFCCVFAALVLMQLIRVENS